MKRRYSKRTYYNKDKYSVEHTIIRSPTIDDWTNITNGKQWSINVIPPVEFEGMRKVKHLTVSFSNSTSGGENIPIFYVLAYVPQGYDVNTVNIPTEGAANNLYEPNQYVMSSGVLDFTGGPLRIRTPLARNINSGDRIALTLATANTTGPAIYSEVKYAITLQ